MNFLVGSEDSLSIEIPSGKSFYDFQCTIPQNCPSSYEGQHGHIRYEAKVEVVSPENAVIFTEGFTVINFMENDIRDPQMMVGVYVSFPLLVGSWL